MSVSAERATWRSVAQVKELRTVPIVLAVLVMAVLGASALLGLRVAEARMSLSLAFVPAAAVMGWYCLRRPSLAVALLPAVGAAVPLSVGTGTQSPVVAALAFATALVTFALARAARSSAWNRGAALTAPAVSLVLVWVLAYLWSNVELDPLVQVWPTYWMVQLGGLGVVVISVGVMLLAMQIDHRGPWIEVATWSLIGLGTLVVVDYYLNGTKGLSFMEAGGLFTMWVVALSFSQALFNAQLSRSLRVVLLVISLAWEYKAAIQQTSWFSGWLPTLVVLVALVFFRSRLAFVGLALVAAFVGFWQLDRIYAVVWGMTVEKGDLTRLDIWQQSLDLFGRHPILGTGPAGYAVYFQNVYAGSPYSMSTHNNYADVLAQTGIVGGVVFIWFLAALLYMGWRARRRWREGFRGAFAQGAFAGLIGLLVAMALGDWFIPFVYNQTIAGFRFTVHSWVYLGLLASLALTSPGGTAEATGSSELTGEERRTPPAPVR